MSPRESIQAGSLWVFSDPGLQLAILADPGPWWWSGARVCCESLVVRLAVGLPSRRLALLSAMERWARECPPSSCGVQRALAQMLYRPRELLAAPVVAVVRGALDGADDVASVRHLARLARELTAMGAAGSKQAMAALAELERLVR